MLVVGRRLAGGRFVTQHYYGHRGLLHVALGLCLIYELSEGSLLGSG